MVEKILEYGEELPDWPVDGTTGYDALAAVGGLFVDPDAEGDFTALDTPPDRAAHLLAGPDPRPPSWPPPPGCSPPS